MNRIRLHTDYLGFRLYLVGEDGFARDAAGRYIVHVLISRIGEPRVHSVRIPNCVAWSSQEAEKLSWAHGRRLVDEKLFPLPQPATLAGALMYLAERGYSWKPDRFGADADDVPTPVMASVEPRVRKQPQLRRPVVEDYLALA